MRSFDELKMSKFSKIRGIPAPTRAEIEDFEQHFGVRLPAAYVDFLNYSNGGHPELDAYRFYIDDLRGNDTEDEVGSSNVDVFLYLNSDKDGPYSVWHVTSILQRFLGNRCAAIGENGGGSPIYLDFTSYQPSVRILHHRLGGITPLIADSFEEFIDGLYENPDYL